MSSARKAQMDPVFLGKVLFTVMGVLLAFFVGGKVYAAVVGGAHSTTKGDFLNLVADLEFMLFMEDSTMAQHTLYLENNYVIVGFGFDPAMSTLDYIQYEDKFILKPYNIDGGKCYMKPCLCLYKREPQQFKDANSISNDKAKREAKKNVIECHSFETKGAVQFFTLAGKNYYYCTAGAVDEVTPKISYPANTPAELADPKRTYNEEYKYMYFKGDSNKCNLMTLYVDVYSYPGKSKQLVFMAPIYSNKNNVQSRGNYYGSKQGQDLTSRYYSMFVCPSIVESVPDCVGKKSHDVVSTNWANTECDAAIYSSEKALCIYEDNKCHHECVHLCSEAMNTITETGLITEPCACADDYKKYGYCLTVEDPTTGDEVQQYLDLDCSAKSVTKCEEYCSTSISGRSCNQDETLSCQNDLCQIAVTEAQSSNQQLKRGKRWACQPFETNSPHSSGATSFGSTGTKIWQCGLEQVDI